MGDALSRLDYLVENSNVSRENIVVESYDPEALSVFLKNEYLTSYYLPSDLRSLDSLSLSSFVNHIQKKIDTYKPYYISTDFRDYDLVDQYFHDHKKLLWYSNLGDYGRVKAKWVHYKLLKDPTVDALLTKQ